MNSWLTLVASVVAALLTGAGGAAAINALARRNVTKVEVVERLNEATLEWAEQLKADAVGARTEASEARKEAAEARREVYEVRREMRIAKAEAEQLTGYMAQVIRWIQSPEMSMDRLRALVTAIGPVNGQSGQPNR